MLTRETTSTCKNQIWCALVALAADLLVRMQTLALTEHEAAAGSQSGCACDY
ncbi:hypothetical protein [Modestobacter sp. URMC 112]